jgi:hypothetical protein
MRPQSDEHKEPQVHGYKSTERIVHGHRAVAMLGAAGLISLDTETALMDALQDGDERLLAITGAYANAAGSTQQQARLAKALAAFVAYEGA